MTTSSKAAPQAGHGVRLWWLVLVSGTTFSIILNLWHALTATGPKTHAILGIIFAIVPAAFAALLSHGLIHPTIGWGMQMAILSLFMVSMLTSIASQAAVLRPYGGGYGAEWSVPLVLDASALIALNFIAKAAKAAREAIVGEAEEADRDAVRAELRPGVEAELRAELQAELRAAKDRLEAELADRKTELEAELKRNQQAELNAARTEVREELGTELRSFQDKLEAELDDRKQALETQYAARLTETETQIRQRAEEEIRKRVRQAEVETEARIRLETVTAAKPKAKAKASETASKQAPDDGLTLKDRARILLEANPDLTGADLGRALDVSARYGRQLLGQLTEEPKKEKETAPADVRLRAVH